MPVRSRKQQTVKVMQCVPDRGIDLSTAPAALNDNALTRAYNLWYEPNINGLVTRYGLSLTTAPALPAGISKLHYHVMANGTAHLLAATATTNSTDALYRLDESGSTPAWAKILDLQTSDGNAPGLLSFDGVLLIADGRNGGLVAWDGSTINVIQGSPAKPTVVTTIANRVVCNSISSPDAVFFSEPEQYDKWDTVSPGNAVIIPAGFGDGMTINALAALYTTLIVSKVHKDSAGNITQKRLHMISTSGTTANWSGSQLSQTSCAVGLHGMAGVADTVFFLDSDGAQSLSPSAAGAYGDIAVDTKIGPKVRPLIAGMARKATQATVQWVRNLGQLWFIVRSGAASVVALYHPMQGGGAWAELQFPVAMRSLCEVGERVYIGGDDGRLYLLAPTGTDETPAGTQPIYATLRTKKYEQMGGDVILRGVKLGVGRVLPTNIRIEAVDEGGGRYLVAEQDTAKTGSSAQKIYDAKDKISAANWKISGGSDPVSQYFDFKANVRKAGLYMQVRTIGGRVVFEGLNGMFAMVG